MRDSHGDTTCPSTPTEVGPGGDGAIVLAWVFPRWDMAPTRVEQEPLALGRDSRCQVVLPGSETSRRHAELRREGPLLVLRDLGSRNGVYVDGRKLDEAPIQLGSVVRVGDWIAVAVPACSVPAQGAYGEPAPGLYAGPVLAPVLEQARRAAASDLPIVLVGETGTGKERVALALHAWSGRRGPFKAVNCAALPASLAEAELFGYRKGAFTGADVASEGHFRSADGGTLLLDEIADLPLGLQAKLLRAIEAREVQPLGESSAVVVDVRLLAATQEPLDLAVRQGRFRADLLARLDGLTVTLPPLRERRAEVPFLFTRLLARHAGGRPPRIDSRVIERLCLDELPFNVRELDLLTRRLLVLHGTEPVLRCEHLPKRVAQPGGEEPAAGAEREAPVLDRLLAALARHGGVVSRAAAELGISRQRAYRLMEARGGVDLDALRAGADQGPRNE